MKKKHIKIIMVPICLSILGLFSCQGILKYAMGVTDAEIVIPNSVRIDYYKPFLEVNADTLQIFAMKDSVALVSAFKKFSSFPHIVANNLATNNKYLINCYDDVSSQIDEINSGDFRHLHPISDSIFNITVAAVKKDSELVHYRDVRVTNQVWEIYIVSGTFLGPKLRNRTVPITRLHGIRSIRILDLSTNGPG